MVMADVGDHDRGRRKRRRGTRRDFPEHDMMMMPTRASKPPVILAKPSSHLDVKKSQSTESLNGPEGGSTNSMPVDKPPILLKSRSENHHIASINGSVNSGINMVSSDGSGTAPVYSIQRPQPAGGHRLAPGSDNIRHHVAGEGFTRLAPPPEMTRCIKLVDESFNWCESGMELLLDQTDFLVIGVLGLQGVGKSTILSHLADCDIEPSKNWLAFRPQQKEMREVCSHQTVGIDMYVTSERTIYLDTQPVLSASVLHHFIQHDKKYPTEFSSAENCVEIQSLQLAAFILTVCNVVLVVADWFIDTNLIRFLKTAEMLKPPTPGHDSNIVEEYFPNVVFLLNKAERDDFSVETYTSMQATLDVMMSGSRLNYKGGINMVGCRGLPGLTTRTVQNKVNLALVSEMNDASKDNDGVLSLMPAYRGHPGFASLMNSLRKQLLAIPRHLLTHTTLSEKNWFHYAARTWDGAKKSQMFLEYNRLLP
ncbi:hypothetical protein LSH36_345g00009 [Paralvinella palmiformis]|uniref:Protein SMG9 n=1 Tax=Paralvinella palmiformis TaxID=53620 RepID=A0AAD9JEZ3_9ANNE|nr:hypothetical protein LSH36_345g00009 [Paralvinella palmiformis]